MSDHTKYGLARPYLHLVFKYDDSIWKAAFYLIKYPHHPDWKLNLAYQANMRLNNANMSFKLRESECLLYLPAAAKLRLVVGRSGDVSEKTKKSINQRAPATRYYQIKELQSLHMKYYLVAGGLLSLVERYDNMCIYYVLTIGWKILCISNNTLCI